MTQSRSPKFFSAAARWFYTGMSALVLCSAISALAANEQTQRWLFVFDTSSAMKKRLPAVEAEIKTQMLTSVGGKLRDGDSIGVWTFDEKLHMGQFPLTTWMPERTPGLTSNLVAFVRQQRYSGGTSFAALQPTLDRVIADSERLTVVIFCDGEGQIHWTPYDSGINETLRQTAADRKKLRQPCVILLRTQEGKYVGATVNFPPVPANIPPFPLLPREIKPSVPTNPPVKVVVIPPPVATPALIIVGTHVSSDTNDLTKNFPVASNPVPVLTPTTNAPLTGIVKPAPAPVLHASNPPMEKTVFAPVVTNVPVTTTTNAAAATSVAGEDKTTRILIYLGVGLLAAAVALVIFLVARGRRGPHSSLITSSMQNDPRPPPQK